MNVVMEDNKKCNAKECEKPKTVSYSRGGDEMKILHSTLYIRAVWMHSSLQDSHIIMQGQIRHLLRRKHLLRSNRLTGTTHNIQFLKSSFSQESLSLRVCSPSVTKSLFPFQRYVSLTQGEVPLPAPWSSAGGKCAWSGCNLLSPSGPKLKFSFWESFGILKIRSWRTEWVTERVNDSVICICFLVLTFPCLKRRKNAQFEGLVGLSFTQGSIAAGRMGWPRQLR